MGSFDRTRAAARNLRDDARGNVDSVSEDVRSVLRGMAERAGIAEDEAQRMARDLTSYGRDWANLVRDDISRELKITITNALMVAGAGFVAAIGFVLLNFGAVWSIANVGGNVGIWFFIFGGAWLVIAAVLGATAYAWQKKATRRASQKFKEDVSVPRRHARDVVHHLQEVRRDSSGTHGHA